MTEFKYCIYCGEDKEPVCFGAEADAMKFAREEANNCGSVRVEKTELDENDDIISSEVIWEATINTEEPEEILEPENPFETEFPKSDIEDIEISDDVDYDKMAQDWQEYQSYVPADWDDPNRFPPKKEDFSIKEAVANLEEHESEVECKCCFDLFPKETCVKTENGYICKKCNQELHSHQGTNLDLVDANPFDLDYDDPRLPEEEEEPEVKEEPVDANEVRKFEAGIEEKLEEHVNDRPADIESDQEYQGVDNAVVDCKKYTLVAHSEDEKPVDCKLEKPALEEPLAGEKVDADLYEELSEEEKKALDEELENLDLEEEAKDPKVIDELLAELHKIEKEEGWTITDQKLIDKVINDAYITYMNWVHNANDTGDAEGALTVTFADLGPEIEADLKANGYALPESLQEAKKDDELPVDPEAAKLEVHTMLNDLVADEIEAINGYEEAKKEILDAPISHKDNILDTVDHIEDEEKEHVDELISATTEIPFDKESDEVKLEQEERLADEANKEIRAKIENGEVEEEPLDQDFPEVEENLTEAAHPILYKALDNEYASAGYNVQWWKKGSAEAERPKRFNAIKDAINFAKDLGKNTAENVRVVIALAGDNKIIVDWKNGNLVTNKLKELYKAIKLNKKADKHGANSSDLIKLSFVPGAGCKGTPAVAYKGAGEKVKLPEKPASFAGTLDKPKFKGWQVGSDEKLPGDEIDTPNTDIEITAIWEANADVESDADAVEESYKDPFYIDFPKNEEKPLVEVAAPLPFDSDVKVGDKIRIIHLEGEDNSYDGKEGTVDHIDSIGQLHGTWGGLAVIPGVDQYEVLVDEMYTQARAEGRELTTDEIEEVVKDDTKDNVEKANLIIESLDDAKLQKIDEYVKENGLKYEGEYTDEGHGPYYYVDEISYYIEYKNNRYELTMATYHSSEDNNAENPEGHTEEIEEVFDTLSELADEFPEVAKAICEWVNDEISNEAEPDLTPEAEERIKTAIDSWESLDTKNESLNEEQDLDEVMFFHKPKSSNEPCTKKEVNELATEIEHEIDHVKSEVEMSKYYRY